MPFASRALTPSSTRTRLLGAALVGLAAATAAIAQVPAPFVGTWTATWQTDKRSYEAEMTVTDAGGTWKTAAREKNNPCVGREVPMKVQSSSANEAKFVLQFSEVIPGCENTTVTLRADPAGSVTGVRSKYELTLVKK